MTKRALICGITGQDGAYLAKYLLDMDYSVWGTSRSPDSANTENLIKLGVLDRVQILKLDSTDFAAVYSLVLDISPDEIYNFMGPSSVAISFKYPAENILEIVSSNLNFLEVLRLSSKNIKYYFSASSECFGDTNGIPANESFPHAPHSPYGAAKSSAYMQVSSYRSAYQVWACSGLCFNHESPFRSHNFVSQKIVSHIKTLAAGGKSKLKLGNLQVKRDWGWAPEYVTGIWNMLQLDSPTDFVLGTGISTSLEEFVSHAHKLIDLDYRDFVEFDESFVRPSEIMFSGCNPSKALIELGWRPKTTLPEIIKKMFYDDYY